MLNKRYHVGPVLCVVIRPGLLVGGGEGSERGTTRHGGPAIAITVFSALIGNFG